MLYIVLVLVLAAFGLLIAALTTANTLWAWLSVLVSVVAATLLVADWWKGRRRAGAEGAARPTVVTVGGARRPAEPADVDGRDDYRDDSLGGHRADQRADHRDDPDDRLDDRVDDEEDLGAEGELPAEPASGSADAERTGKMAPVALDNSAEPDEEPTDASDLLVVAGLTAEVRVVDEHPRYHLATCTWLGPRPTIPIPVSEARQLGFTPCARCGPDAVLAARHRAAR